MTRQIKKELKENGIKARVRKTYAGCEEVYNIYVAEEDVEKAERIISKFEKIERNERSGEILAGGNTYIFVKGA